MCIELLVELSDAGATGGALIDLGTGSGVLAIAAAKLGWGPVRACDHEQAAIDAAGHNAAANGVKLQLRQVNLREGLPELAPTMVANLTSPLLLEIAAWLVPETVPRRLICSGLLASEAERISDAFASAGFIKRQWRSEGDWAAISFAPG